jgi:hypothetical protein
MDETGTAAASNCRHSAFSPAAPQPGPQSRQGCSPIPHWSLTACTCTIPVPHPVILSDPERSEGESKDLLFGSLAKGWKSTDLKVRIHATKDLGNR